MEDVKETKMVEAPNSVDIERSLLGALLWKSEDIHSVIQKLPAQSFYLDKNRYVYEAMVQLTEEGGGIDVATVGERMRRNNILEYVGRDYLSSLVDSAPATINIPTYTSQLLELFVRRKVLEATTVINRLCYDTSVGVDDVIDRVDRELVAIARGHLNSSEDKSPSVEEVVKQIVDTLEKGELARREASIMTGINVIDNYTLGINKSQVVSIVATPSVGKTALCMNIMYNMARDGYKCGFLSSEMSSRELVERLVGIHSSTDENLLETPIYKLGEPISRGGGGEENRGRSVEPADSDTGRPKLLDRHRPIQQGKDVR